MKNDFYIYIYLDPRKSGAYNYKNITLDHEPFYVGYGRGNRKYFHLNESKTKKNSLKLNKIRKLNSLNLKPIILTYKENLSEENAKKLEIEIITSIGRVNLNTGPLSNLTNGGDGTSGLVFSKELREKLSKAKLGELNHMFNKNHSTKTKDKIRNTRNEKIKKGEIIPYKHTDEWKNKLKNNNPFHKKVDDFSIIQLNKEGKTNKEISKITGITTRIIENRLEKHGLERNKNKNDKIIVNIDEIHNLRLKGLLYKEIASILNVSESVISRNYRNSKYYKSQK